MNKRPDKKLRQIAKPNALIKGKGLRDLANPDILRLGSKLIAKAIKNNRNYSNMLRNPGVKK